MISSVASVPSGVLKGRPVRADVFAEDLLALKGRLEQTMRAPEDEEESEASGSEKETQALKNTKEAAARVTQEAPASIDPEMDDDMKELKFDEYDTDEDDVTDTRFLDNIVASMPQDYSIDKNESDHTNDDSGGEDSEDESVEIGDSDVVLLTTKAEDILSCIEIWLYEDADDEQEGNLFVHRDVPLAHFPLCCEYVDVQPKSAEKCNFVAVGCMECAIEFYDLDVMDPIAPTLSLHSSSKKKRRSSVTTLSANGLARNVMASGSDDKRIRIWDLAKGKCTSEMKLHKASVQCVKWNPHEAPILVSGGHDKKCTMIDVRSPDGTVLEWKLGSDNESLAWCEHQQTAFLASDEEGVVRMFDARKGTKSEPVFALNAHKDNATVVSVCPLNSSLFMTASEDGKVKVWRLDEGEPQLVDKKSLGVGEILAGGFCSQAGHLIAAAGDSGSMQVWDVRASSSMAPFISDAVYIPRIYRNTNL